MIYRFYSASHSFTVFFLTYLILELLSQIKTQLVDVYKGVPF